MTKHYDNPTERRATLENDRRAREAGTFHGVAVAEQNTVGGRYAAVSKSSVTGSRMDQRAEFHNSPWGGDPVPDEPPLGIDINAMEPVGTHKEIQDSLAALDPRDGSDQHAVERPGDAQQLRRAPPSLASEVAPSPPQRRRN